LRLFFFLSLSACLVQSTLSDGVGNHFHPIKILLFSLSAVLVKPDSDSERSSLTIVFIDGILNERRIASRLSNSQLGKHSAFCACKPVEMLASGCDWREDVRLAAPGAKSGPPRNWEKVSFLPR